MPYSTSLPGLGEAVRDAIKAKIVADVANLHAAINRDSACPMTWAAGQIVLGDAIYLTASRISVVGGGEADARDMRMEKYFAPLTDTQGFRTEISTNIYVYIHPDEFTGQTEEAQATMRQLALERTCDHLRRRIFNDPANIAITLTSREHSISPNFDLLKDCYIREIRLGVTPKMFGKFQEVPSGELVHIGWIA